jgi:hypothetical protein
MIKVELELIQEAISGLTVFGGVATASTVEKLERVVRGVGGTSLAPTMVVDDAHKYKRFVINNLVIRLDIPFVGSILWSRIKHKMLISLWGKFWVVPPFSAKEKVEIDARWDLPIQLKAT